MLALTRFRASRTRVGQRRAVSHTSQESEAAKATRSTGRYVAPEKIDPGGRVRRHPGPATAVPGWGDLPDQHGRRWDGDDGASPLPRRPKQLQAELPPLLPYRTATA